MKTSCPSCSHYIVVDDSKLPSGPFMLRCPKCKAMAKVPGKVDTKPATSAGVQQPPHRAASAPSNGKPPAADKPAAAPATEKQAGEASRANQSGTEIPQRALVALPDSVQAKHIEAILRRQGYAIDPLDQSEEQIVQLQTGAYCMVVTHRNGASAEGQVDIYRLVNALAPEVRRRLFLVLVGNEFKTGNGTQAFAAMADFVCHSQGTETTETLLRGTIAEKSRLYHAFLDVERAY